MRPLLGCDPTKTKQKRSMARNGDSHRNDQGPSRVRKASEVHKRRVDKTTRRDVRSHERETARSQVRQEEQAEFERQERFRIIHGGREVSPEEAAAFAAHVDAQRRLSDEPAESARQAAVETRPRTRRPEITLPAIETGDRASRASVSSTDGVQSGTEHVAATQVGGNSIRSSNVEAGEEGKRPDAPAAAHSQDAATSGAAQDGAPKDGGGLSDAPASPDGVQVGTGQAGNDVSAAADAQYADDDEAESDGFDDGRHGEPPEKPHRTRRIVLIVVGIAIAVIAILMGLFCWNRWLRYDDTVEIQGEWFAAFSGRRAPIVIGSDTIEFNSETKWHYTLDTTAKTITFTFGSQSGGGRYWFVGDHEHLVIEDGIDFSAFDTFMADLQRTLTGQADVVPQGATITVLSRSADAVPVLAGTMDESSPAIEGDGRADDDAAKSAAEEDAGSAEVQPASEEGEAQGGFESVEDGGGSEPDDGTGSEDDGTVAADETGESDA